MNQDVQVSDHFSYSEKGGVLTPGHRQVWGEWSGRMMADWRSICSEADTIDLKRELRVKLSVYWSVYVPVFRAMAMSSG